MTMRWKISEAKARFSELVAKGQTEPQIIMNREHPVAVLMDMQSFEQFQLDDQERKRPKVGDLLKEIREINLEEDDCWIPPRVNREIEDLTHTAE